MLSAGMFRSLRCFINITVYSQYIYSIAKSKIYTEKHSPLDGSYNSHPVFSKLSTDTMTILHCMQYWLLGQLVVNIIDFKNCKLMKNRNKMQNMLSMPQYVTSILNDSTLKKTATAKTLVVTTFPEPLSMSCNLHVM